jgi:large subunit ribosomal protein L24
MRARIKKNDTVMVIAGRERGKTGKVLRVLPEKGRALIEQLNMVKRHQKARGPQSASGIVEKEAPLHLSNLMIMCDKCNAPVRMGKRELDDGHSVRVCRRCGEQLDR